MAFTMSYIFEAIDKFTGPIKGIQKKLDETNKQVTIVSKHFNAANESAKRLGQGIGLFLDAPLVAFGYESVKAFNDSAQAIAQLNAAIKSTGGAAGFTSEQLQHTADSLQSKSLFTHVDILKQVTAQLMRFGRVHGDVFLKAQQDIIDYSARTGRGLQQGAVLLGKALDDPIHGLMRLRIAGISFTKSQTDMIDKMVKTGHLADAQGVILDAFAKRFGGAAEAAAMAGTGPIQQLRMSFHDLEEQIGGPLANAINSIVPYLKDAVDWLKSLDPATKKTILVVVGLTAVLGPLILIVGQLTISLRAMAVVVALLEWPVTGIIAAIALLVYAFFKVKAVIASLIPTFKQFWSDITGWFKDLLDWGDKVATMFDDVINKVKTIPIIGKIFQGNDQTGGQSLLNSHPGALGIAGINSAVDINLNVNDKNNNIGIIQTKAKGSRTSVNVGRNMAHV